MRQHSNDDYKEVDGSICYKDMEQVSPVPKDKGIKFRNMEMLLSWDEMKAKGYRMPDNVGPD